ISRSAIYIRIMKLVRIWLATLCCATLFLVVSCKWQPCNFSYPKWAHLSPDDHILAQYKPRLERSLNVRIDSPTLYRIDHFTKAAIKGMPIFQYNVSFCMKKTNQTKSRRFVRFEKYKITGNNHN